MGELLVDERQVVVPGQVLAKGMDYLPNVGTYRKDENILASRLGLVRLDGKVIKLIPLSGKYLPKVGDTIIAKITDVTMSSWMAETNSAYTAMLNVKDATSQFIARGADLTRYFNFGDYIVTKIINVTSQKLVDLTMKGQGLRKLNGGRIIAVEPSKVPRIVGKSGSMVNMIKHTTNCRVIVGQNGLIWLNGEPENELVAIEAIKKIEKESHISGLTERVQQFLDDSKGRIVQSQNGTSSDDYNDSSQDNSDNKGE
ncbi:MAG: exosome complex RNA-binding protein Rrp4 [Candidatus Woesearchaeota archaeon]